MRKGLVLTLFAAVCLFASPAVPQTSHTALVIHANWDNNTSVQGTVTLGKVNKSGPDTVLAVKKFVNGETSVTESLEASAVYSVTIRDASSKELLAFPFTTALIDPNNLSGGEIDLVFHAANRLLASARITVKLEF
jgi:hypothetical protein